MCSFAFPREDISGAIRSLLRLPNVTANDRMAMFQMLEWFDEGFDFADALHYVSSAGLELKTFDKKFISKARRHQLNVTAP